MPLSHPTILSILRSAIDLADSLRCPLSDLRLWKDDIKGAFGQFNFDPTVCYLLATQVAKGIVMIYIAGMFGYHACPLIFGVFSRAITRALAVLCCGLVYVYVDDLIGFSHHCFYGEERSTRSARPSGPYLRSELVSGEVFIALYQR